MPARASFFFPPRFPEEGPGMPPSMARAAIVTASDSGIGKATAVALAAGGYDVGITWHSDVDGANETAAEVRSLGRHAEVRQLDLSQRLPDAVDVIDDLSDALGGVYALVNNAGISKDGPALELSYGDWRETLAVDLDGAFLCAQRAGRHMVDAGEGGRIVNVTSVHELVPLPESIAYVAAKHALGGVTKQLALELGRHRITVNSVAPGEIATPMTGNEDVDPRTVERPHVPVGRPGDAREVASLIAWLCSDDAAFVTGASIVIDGGLLLVPALRNQAQASE
jgi:NAD(P)-dependent dehydrogenase (short-subunit alcohol dehydrogenase family)